MDNNAINCDIVKDLIPLYSEGLCSETGSAAVEDHLKTCESCRKLLSTPIEQIHPAPVPSEKNVFKKLSRRLKMNMAVMISLGVLLLGVLGVVGFLSFGQIVKGDGMVSFETISQSVEIKKLAKLIANKDFKEYLYAADCDIVESYGITRRVGLEGLDYDEIREHRAAEFAKIYNEVVGDRKVKEISAHSKYIRYVNELYQIETVCTLKYDDGANININFSKKANSITGYIMGIDGFESENSNVLRDSFSLLISSDDEAKRLLEMIIMVYCDPEHEEEEGNRADFFSRRFAKDYWEQISTAFAEFLTKGYTVTDCDISYEIYDAEYNHFSNIWIKAQDDSGTAIFKGKIYSDIKGLKPPCDIEIYRDGCSDELAESLAKMFG